LSDFVLPRPLRARHRLTTDRIQRPHHADPRPQRLAVVFDCEQCPRRRLPCRRVVLALRQLGDEVAGITQREQLATVGERNWIVESGAPDISSDVSERGVEDR
jgi:hypothetical protein